MEPRIVQISGRAVLHKRFGGAQGGLNSARTNAHRALMSLAVPLCRDVGGHTDECNIATDALVDARLMDMLKA